MTKTTERVNITGERLEQTEAVLTPEASEFLVKLHERFNSRRKELLTMRAERQRKLDSGTLPDFLSHTREIRNSDWCVAPAPQDLIDRRVEITGPVEAKMIINALNSGALVFMADFEDALSPTWNNVIDGQVNLQRAVRKTLTYESPEGKKYALKSGISPDDRLAALVVRPRGWHLEEVNFQIDGQPISAGLFDFGLYFFHNARELIERQSGPYFYLPKLESHLEARLWNDVFVFAQDYLGMAMGTIRATVLIETILAAFEMDEILYELKDHAAGLNAGRWDYIFSLIKKTRKHARFLLPDRAQVTMASPFMRAYAQLLVKTCHRRKAHAIGGMAAFIPSRRDEQINQMAFLKVREDKNREAEDGFDGTWVAHPDLVPVAKEVFDRALGEKPNQKDRMREDVNVDAKDLLDTHIEGTDITRDGVRANIDVALQYIESWLRGTGAAAIHNLMEDAATAEIARAQLWQWINHEAKTHEGEVVDERLYLELKKEVIDQLLSGETRHNFREAEKLLDEMVLSRQFTEFMTIAAYPYLIGS